MSHVSWLQWLILLWPVLSAVLSLIYTRLDKDSRAHAIFSTLAALGIDIPKIIEAVGRIINPPAALKAKLSAHPPPPPPPVITTLLLLIAVKLAQGFLLVSALVIAASLPGCPAVQAVPNLPSDVGGAVSCVIDDAIHSRPITDCVAKYGPALVDDAIQIVLDSKSFTTEHPEAVPRLIASRETLRPVLP